MDVYDSIAAIKDRSLRGQASQLLFRAEAAARGFVPSTPEWPLTMDHILIDNTAPHRLLRVEVKQSQQRRANGSFVVELRGAQGIGGAAGSKKGRERLHEYERSVDVIAIFLPLARSWYLIPEAKLRSRSSVTLNPSDPTSKFYEWRDNWGVIADKMHSVGDAPIETRTTKPRPRHSSRRSETD